MRPTPDQGSLDGAVATARPGAQEWGEHIQRLRVGHGANCSSIGSVVDTLFATATIGAAVFAAVVAALAKEPVRVAAARTRRTSEPPPGEPSP